MDPQPETQQLKLRRAEGCVELRRAEWQASLRADTCVPLQQESCVDKCVNIQLGTSGCTAFKTGLQVKL